MRCRFRPPEDDEQPGRYLMLIPDTVEERTFCRELMEFFRERGQ